MVKKAIKHNLKLLKNEKRLAKLEKGLNSGYCGHYFYVIFFAGCVALGAVLFLQYGQKELQVRQFSLGDIILDAVESSELDMKNLEQLKALLAGEDNELAQYMKTHLRPIQERVSSIRTQINQYEKMEQVPGGPTHFMSTTLDELESLWKRLLEIQAEVIIVSQDGAKRIYSIYQTHTETLPKNNRFTSGESITELGGWGIFIGPGDNDVEIKDIPKYTQGKTLPEVLDHFRRLGSLFIKFDEARAKVDEKLVELNLPTLSSTGTLRLKPGQQLPPEAHPFMPKLEQSLKTLRQEIHQNQENYKTFLPLNILLGVQLVEQLHKAHSYEKDQLGLAQSILSSVSQETHGLKIRVNNLKVVYTKKSLKDL